MFLLKKYLSTKSKLMFYSYVFSDTCDNFYHNVLIDDSFQQQIHVSE